MEHCVETSICETYGLHLLRQQCIAINYVH